MEKILSKDGTPIAYQRTGTGPPLVLVHGTLGSCKRWPVLPTLGEQFTVNAIERRGYGESGDSASYAVEREFEDIAALVNSLGEGVSLLGHSFGGFCVLEAALLTPNLRRLIVYEPSPLPVPGTPLYPDGIIDRYEAMLDAGERENVVTTMFRELVGMPPDEIELLKASPTFPSMVAAAHTIPRESRAEEDYRFEPERFKHFNVPTMLLLGGDSPEFFKKTIERWHAALPNSRIVVLPGQQHIAHYTSP
ncbi:MAG: alpha/beta hydrolase, partial [Candidatus Methanoperedens sp.]|nr:alpha/beta hydrolase [Candidatus Methanoperedens sp.]